ncbi:bifunctional 2-polyprenyl-6-hydroxyphenol methylase/3-demethylubiquinol 3-O-methyltransferase UbiG [Halobacillus sp. A5]|uniref:class I SAM-dependent methyltransferase n=1 Tax=Halobacillus sp. A5 TaxID=2880263 RepID=UPI0020A6CECD|nr:class I SAM-dependent methyltransferase [Halobacillus sp. A5]MCP3029347.1 methyltransferase domain-containing protein [Halobacillus sp. A5]
MLTAHTEYPRPYSDQHIGHTEKLPSFRLDLRNYSAKEYNKFVSLNTVKDWSQLSWKDVGKPYEVKSESREKRDWERQHNRTMDAHTSWTFFNKAFHEWFIKDVPKESHNAKQNFLHSLRSFKPQEVKQALGSVIQMQLWNYVHRIQDGIWDPRGKRALFEGLDVKKPKILFLGAAEGYEAMQLGAMYPGAEIVMVDYDEYCKTTRFSEFPEGYPFLGSNPQTGQSKVYYKEDFTIEYVVDDIRNLKYGKEFDIVLSVGLLEHFPDEYKHEAADWHRRFLKPGGYCVLTTPRNQIRSRVYYRIMADVMNHTYRELMTVEQMGLYMYESGFNICRHGFIKVHNGIVCQPR